MTAFTDSEVAPDRQRKSQPQRIAVPNPVDDDLDRPARIRRLRALTRTIESEIIPRLLLAHAPIEQAIGMVRPVCADRDLVVMVGGRPFNEDPDLYLAVGADATAPDASSAVGVADRLLSPNAQDRLRHAN